MKITKHFCSEEFGCHDPNRTPYPGVWIAERLVNLCENLEKIRRLTGQSMTILSGYRTPAWNRHVKGATNSQHVQGRAADIRLSGMSTEDLYSAMIHLVEQKVIFEGGIGYYPESPKRSLGWIHYDIGPARIWTG